MSVSSELRDKKLAAYGKKIPGLGLYGSVLLPIIALLLLGQMLLNLLQWEWLWPFFILNCLAFVLCIFAFFALRKYNAFGYWCNLAFLVLLAVSKVAYTAWALFEVASSGGVGAIGMTQGPGYVGLSMLQAGPSAIAIIFEVLLLAVAVFYFVVFLRNRKFFFADVPA